MASNGRTERSRGRTTPESTPARAKSAGNAGKAVRGGEQLRRRGPLSPDEPVTVGRRPSSPRFLLVVAVMWLAVGVIVIVALNSTWKLIPAVFAIGVGLFFLRGAGATVLRRQRRGDANK